MKSPLSRLFPFSATLFFVCRTSIVGPVVGQPGDRMPSARNLELLMLACSVFQLRKYVPFLLGEDPSESLQLVVTCWIPLSRRIHWSQTLARHSLPTGASELAIAASVVCSVEFYSQASTPTVRCWPTHERGCRATVDKLSQAKVESPPRPTLEFT
eukprot:Blabericola_migrator_1__1381@NODE_1359_length_4725_cov_105_142121_g912_i0_p5_GENE_NODE_1359_length_4725_cov_105_142121_g912_i0NODE_1359_length_4725_cov_105_142121_g912_i0_p5_ORF_typecomplete_len156_score6_37RT_RNaseH/PF17917_1/1_5e03RT_RNaseH/PF17917_1/0_61_NODE_1359_length_4725_cov_105_142121_g912_i0256723